MSQSFLSTPGGNVYPDPDSGYDQSEAFRVVALNRDAQDQSLERLFDEVHASSKKYTLLTPDDVLHELPPGRYSLASGSGIDFETLGYPTDRRGLLFVDEWVNSEANRILRYFTDTGDAYMKAVSLTSTGQWRQLTPEPITYLTANDHLLDLPPGRYALAITLGDGPSLGYPTTSRGVLMVETFSSSTANRIMQYFAETGGVYTQVVTGNSGHGWTDLTRGGGAITPGGGATDTTPRLILNTEPGHPFYKLSSHGTWEPDDTMEKAVGTQSVRVSTDGDGEIVDVRADNVGPFDLTRTNPKFWIRVPDWDTSAVIHLHMGSSPSDHYRWNVHAHETYLEDGLWRQLTVSELSAAAKAGNPDPENLTHVWLRSRDNEQGQLTYNLGPFYATPKSGAYSQGVVSMSFDDGRLNNYTIAKPIMDKYGFAGTEYVIVYALGSPGRLTVEQLREMQDYSGWEIGGHAYAEGLHSNLTQFTEQELDEDMANLVQWQKDNGLKGGTFSYPGGAYNDMVKRVTLKHFKAGRAIHSFWETLPPNDLGALTTPVYVRYPEDTPESIQQKIFEAQAHGMWLHLCFHGVEDVSSSHLEYPTEWFEEVCEMLYESGIPVRTVEQVIDAM